MPRILGNIELYMGPQQLGAPDDLLAAIVGFIDGAQKRLYIAVQELDARPIAEAIIRARRRKVVVKLVLEADYLVEKILLDDPFAPGGEFEINRFLHGAILRSHILVNSDFNPDIFHQKFMVRDGISLLTGSANFTDTDTAQNLNHVVIIHDRKVAKAYEREFDEIQDGHFGKLDEGHDSSPDEIDVSGIRVKVLFAPDHNPEMEIMKQIAKAKERVDFAIFTFARSSGIDDQMALAAKAGIVFRGALFRDQANQAWSAKNILKGEPGIDMFLVPRKNLPKPSPRKLHHKLMVIDRRLVIVGSFNYTGPANRLNDENIIILGDLDCPDPAIIQLEQRLAQYALDEIDRMIDKFGERA
jgi:phosphatidylserine/phosphatidylglycerophosphate/cardiolipin synthase-like enzyme